MHFQYLVEDQSGAALIRILMQKIVELYPNATYDCKGFRGIGGFTRKNTIYALRNFQHVDDVFDGISVRLGMPAQIYAHRQRLLDNSRFPLPSAPLLPNWKSASICSRFLKQQKNNWSRLKRS